MTTAEIIKGLKAVRTIHNGNYAPFIDGAIKELEKQMPQAPTIENGFVKCPKCKKYIRFPIADKYNNCPECGQAIKWEESEMQEVKE